MSMTEIKAKLRGSQSRNSRVQQSTYLPSEITNAGPLPQTTKSEAAGALSQTASDKIDAEFEAARARILKRPEVQARQRQRAEREAQQRQAEELNRQFFGEL